MLENIIRVRDVYQEWCFEHSLSRDHLGLLVEFDEHISDVKRDIQRVEVLKERLQSTIRLLTDLLSYEEACMLKSLALESHNEGIVTSQLAFQSTKDAAAVKVLTIISLIYLPTTIVANFFSTEFVKANNGKMEISPQSWVLPAVALPLTSLTLCLWWLCVRFSPPVHTGDKGLLSLRRRVRDIAAGKDSSDLEEGLQQKEREYKTPPRRQTMEVAGVGSKPQAKMD
ncbi:uncharacterized protein ACHE_80456A [Aspergillus chevalieri]|uniref:CorA-like Mg2+ transporter protein n=1 Tax=Aspergillus chevalieri TaxID=182096 RepID=A0A7R7ZT67_ASPCH|nr:uncharacterized protein ACHE_80456A [Aspergillus chevalieri]BCR92556.1 hypothetical protein ACHE_80456A [Aspergillus chevalieri]